MKTISKYQISWIILTPKTGKATKRDQKVFNSQISSASGFSIGPFNQNLFAYFSTYEDAKKHIAELGKANKEYKAIIITDAQFGKMKIDHNIKNVNIDFTSKQLKESKII